MELILGLVSAVLIGCGLILGPKYVKAKGKIKQGAELLAALFRALDDDNIDDAEADDLRERLTKLLTW